MNEAPQSPDRRPMTAAEERAAWANHNRESLLSGLEMTAAERFEWLESTWAELAAAGLLTFESTHAPAKPPKRKS